MSRTTDRRRLSGDGATPAPEPRGARHGHDPHSSRRGGNGTSTRGLLPATALAAATAAAAVEAYGAGARLVGVPLRAANIGASHAEAIIPGMFAMGTAVGTFWGLVLALVIKRVATRPARTFAVVACALTLVSFGPPLLAADTAAATKVVLVAGHVLVAAIVVPTVVRHLPARRTPRR